MREQGIQGHLGNLYAVFILTLEKITIKKPTGSLRVYPARTTTQTADKVSSKTEEKMFFKAFLCYDNTIHLLEGLGIKLYLTKMNMLFYFITFKYLHF